MDLRPSGYARLDVVTAGVAGDAPLELAVVRERMRPRSNQRHLPLDHIEKLRNLVHVPPAQPTSDPGDARIVPSGLADVGAVLIGPHRAERDELERLLFESEA